MTATSRDLDLGYARTSVVWYRRAPTRIGEKGLGKFAAQGLPEKEGMWYLVPGKVDSISYWLLGFFVLTVAFLVAFDAAIS